MFMPPSVVCLPTMGSNGRGGDGETQSLLMEAAYHTLCEHGYAGCTDSIPGKRATQTSTA